MKSKLFNFLLTFVLLSGMPAGCSSPTRKKNEEAKADYLLLTKEQFASAGMDISNLEIRNFSDEVKCNGYILASKDGFAQISSPVSGIVESINYSLNEYVSKGKVLFLLSSEELMSLQHDYAETSAKMEKLKADYERSKALLAESIQAKKDFGTIESEFKSIRAKNNAAKLRLQQLGLDVSRIETGDFYTSFPVRAPIYGYIVSQNLALGQYTEPQKVLSEIVDTDQLQLQLSIFENDIWKLNPGQTVNFGSLNEPGIHQATLVSKGKTINPETRTIQCIAEILKEKNNKFVNKSYVMASIKTNQVKATALPNDAIVKSGNDFYVFKLEGMVNDDYKLKKIKVDLGRQSGDYSEIVNMPVGLKVIGKGAYYLNN